MQGLDCLLSKGIRSHLCQSWVLTGEADRLASLPVSCEPVAGFFVRLGTPTLAHFGCPESLHDDPWIELMVVW